jgi:hypothetical protein
VVGMKKKVFERFAATKGRSKGFQIGVTILLVVVASILLFSIIQILNA